MIKDEILPVPDEKSNLMSILSEKGPSQGTEKHNHTGERKYR
jgi:hypothetical protein